MSRAPASSAPTPAALPSQNGTATYPAAFRCIIPNAAQNATPPRISFYGHGLLGSNREVNAGNVRAMADEHNFVFCATHVDRACRRKTFRNAVAILQRPVRSSRAWPDRLQQGILNALFLGRLMKHAEGLSSHDRFPRAAVDRPSALYYDGNSQGGIMGGALTAVATDIDARGARRARHELLDPAAAQRRLGHLQPIYYPAYPDELERGLGISLIQMLWDRGEANGYAHHLTDDPLPDTPPHGSCMHVAFGDHQVTTYAAEVEARTIGASAALPGHGAGPDARTRPALGSRMCGRRTPARCSCSGTAARRPRRSATCRPETARTRTATRGRTPTPAARSRSSSGPTAASSTSAVPKSAEPSPS